MSFISRTLSTARAFFHRGRLADELQEELQFHMEQHTRDLIGQGIAETEAKRRARVALGAAPGTHVERHREISGLRLLDETAGDLQYGLRGLWRNKTFAAIAILSMALGIGAATAMFSVVYAVLLDIYPYADAVRTVNPIVHDPNVPDDWNWFALTPAQYDQYRQARSFSDVTGQSGMGVQLDEEGIEQPIHLVALTANSTEFNRVPALLGRPLQASDGDLGQPAPGIVVLGYKFWRTHFHGDKGIVGSRFKAGDHLYRIVGVMPQRFTLGGTPDVYMPISQLPELGLKEPMLLAFAKLKPGVSAAMASAEVDPMLHQFAHQFPDFYPREFHARLQPLLEGFTARSKVLKNFPMLYLAVGALLLIGCSNCSLLLMARGTSRVHEFALRAAVGASRARIMRQIFVECLTISVLGSALGVALAYQLARLPLLLADDLFPSEAVIRVSLPVLGFSVAVAILAGVLFGMAPALRASRPQLASTLQASSRRASTRASNLPLQVLIASQIALTLVLLTVAGGAAAGFQQILHLPLGYDPSDTLPISVGLTNRIAKTWPERIAQHAAVLHSIEAVPGVLSVTSADDIPPSSGGPPPPFELVGESSLRQPQARQIRVASNYFAQLHIPLLQGRVWTSDEARNGVPLAVVNAAFAKRFFDGRSPVGRSLRLSTIDLKNLHGGVVPPGFDKPEVQIVGVVADSINDGLDKPILPAIFYNESLLVWQAKLFFVHTAGPPAEYSRKVAQAIRAAAGKAYIFNFPFTLSEFVEQEPMWRTQRLIAVLLGIFATFALALSLVGLYSVVSYVAARRTSEFGIRLALGASRSHVLALVMRSNLTVIASGIAAGLVGSFAVRARFAHWSEYSSHSPALTWAAALLLVITATLASLVPAYRASSTEPSLALRAE